MIIKVKTKVSKHTPWSSSNIHHLKTRVEPIALKCQWKWTTTTRQQQEQETKKGGGVWVKRSQGYSFPTKHINQDDFKDRLRTTYHELSSIEVPPHAKYPLLKYKPRQFKSTTRIAETKAKNREASAQRGERQRVSTLVSRLFVPNQTCQSRWLNDWLTTYHELSPTVLPRPFSKHA